MSRFSRLFLIVILALPLTMITTALEEDIQPAAIVNDEGGPVLITGELAYTNAFFTSFAADSIILLEDLTGFVNRDRHYLLPRESQVIAQLTSNVFESPFSYSLQLPESPVAPLNDVDNDEETDPGVQIFQIALWTNFYGDVFVEERDGTGWSGGYSSVITEEVPPDRINEIIGGNLLVYAPGAGQGFSSGFGNDELLFTADDPLVIVPQGWTLVNMDTEPFTFDRSRQQTVDLIEAETSELDDFSELSYTEAFDAMMNKLRTEYAFTEFANIDWDALDAEYRPRIVEAEANEDRTAYYYTIFDMTVAIGDRHTKMNHETLLIDDFRNETQGGIGISIRQVDDRRVLVDYLLDDSPADNAGIRLGAEIIAFDGVPIMEVVNNTRAWSEPFNTEHVRTLQRLRYTTRFLLGTKVEVTFANPGESEQTVTLEAIEERDSFNHSSFNRDVVTTRLPVEWEIVDNMMVVRINSFIDELSLTVSLWERMMVDAITNQVEGIIIDVRNNLGGFGPVADNMAAHFFDEEFSLGNQAIYNEALGDFFFDEEEDFFILPPEVLRYRGPVAVLIGPNCFSACEFFAYDMTINDRAAIVGQYPTIGGGGATNVFLMPDLVQVQMTIGRAVDADGNIHIQNQGVAPTVRVPVNEDTLGISGVEYINGDPILDTAINYLRDANAQALANIDFIDGGTISYDQEIVGLLNIDQRARYTLQLIGNESVSIYVDGSIDSVLRIYDETGENLLQENDDLVGLKSGIEDIVVANDTIIIIEVASFNDEGTGDYTLIVTTGENPLEE